MAVATAERGRNTGHSRGILRVQDAKNEGEGMATNSQLQYSHFPISKVFRHYLKLSKICESFLAVPRRFTFDLSFLVYFSPFQLSPKPAYQSILQTGRDSSRSKFSNYLEAAIALQSCTWRTFFPSCEVCYIQCTTPRREASAIQSVLILDKAMLSNVQSPNF
jgi:hypothetical protein